MASADLDRGDIIWMNFDPQAGREQGGRRPALVVSPRTYNTRVGLALVCPITSQVKGYPFEVLLGPEAPVRGCVLSDHVRSADLAARGAEFVGRVEDSIVAAVRRRIRALA